MKGYGRCVPKFKMPPMLRELITADHIEEFKTENPTLFECCEKQIVLWKEQESPDYPVSYTPEDIFLLAHLAHIFGRVLHAFTQYDLRISKDLPQDHRKLSLNSLYGSCNIVTSELLKGITDSDFSVNTFYLYGILEKLCDKLFISPLMKSVSELLYYCRDKDHNFTVTSKLRLTDSDTTVQSYLKKQHSSYKYKPDPTKFAIACFDNMQRPYEKSSYSLSQKMSEYFVANNVIAVELGFDIPDPFLNFDSNTLDGNFGKCQPEDKIVFEKFKKCMFERSCLIAVKQKDVSLKPIHLSLNSEDEPNRKEKLENLSLEEIMGLDKEKRGIYLKDVFNAIIPGKSESEENILKVLELLSKDFISEVCKKILLNADQKLYNVLQSMRDKPEYSRILKNFDFILDLWHTHFNMIMRILIAFDLRAFFVIIGCTTDPEFKKLSTCHKIGITESIIDNLCTAIQVCIIEYLIEEDPDLNIDEMDDEDATKLLENSYNKYIDFIEENISTGNKMLATYGKSLMHISNCVMAMWTSQKIGNFKLFKAAISRDLGCSPYSWVFNMFNYDHSLAEFHRDLSTFCDYTKYALDNGAPFLRFKDSNILNSIGGFQEMTIKMIFSNVLKNDPEGKSILKSAKYLVPLEENKASVLKMLNISDKSTHKCRQPDLDIINNFRYLIRKFNILGLNKPGNVARGVYNIDNSHEFSRSRSRESFMGFDIDDDEDNNNDDNTADDNDESLDPTNNLSISTDRLNDLDVLQDRMTLGAPLSVCEWDSIDTTYRIKPIQDNTKCVKWFSQKPFPEEFEKAHKKGQEYQDEFYKIIKDNDLKGNTQDYKDHMKSKRKNMCNPPKEVSSTLQPISDKISLSQAGTEPKQSFDYQYSKDGMSASFAAKNDLKNLFEKRFNIKGEHIGNLLRRTCNKLYNYISFDARDICIESNSTNSATGLPAHAIAFCNRYILPLLKMSNVLVFSFDSEDFIHPVEGQRRYEKDSSVESNDHNILLRLFETENSVPILAVRKTDHLARLHYAKKIFWYIFNNAAEIFNSEKGDFVIMVSGVTKDEANLIPITLLKRNGNFTQFSATGLRHNYGEAQFQCFYHLLQFCDENSVAAVMSTDTDLLFHSLAAFTHFRGSQLDFLLLNNNKKKKKDQLILYDISLMCNAVREKYDTINFPMESFLTMCLDNGCGGSYVEKAYGSTIFNSIDAFDNQGPSDLVCDIADSALTLEQKNVLNVAEHTLVPNLSTLKDFHKYKYLSSSKTHKNMDFDGISYEEAVEMSHAEKDNIRHRLASEHSLLNHYLRLVVGYLELSSLRGSHVVPATERILLFGYTKIDPSKPISHHNCIMDFQNKAKERKICVAITKKKKQRCTNRAVHGDYCGVHFTRQENDENQS